MQYGEFKAGEITEIARDSSPGFVKRVCYYFSIRFCVLAEVIYQPFVSSLSLCVSVDFYAQHYR